MPTKLGENLLRLMALKGWQQNDLAKEAGVSEACVSRMISGTNRTPNIRTLQALAKALSVSAGQILEERPSEDLELELQLIRAVRDSPVRGITLRARGLSKEGLEFVTRVIDQVRAYEGLKRVEDAAPQGATTVAMEEDRGTIDDA